MFYEIRRPSGVRSDGFHRALREIGQTAVAVDSDSTYETWMYKHGWAIVDTAYAQAKMPQWLKQHRCVISAYGSYTDIDIASPSVLKRSLRGKAKDRILARDGSHCLLCGNESELTLQHVWPFSAGGETSPRNLVTLCEPCNQQMADGFFPSLFQEAGLPSELEGPLLVRSNFSDDAINRSRYLSRNLMYTRCEPW